MPIGDPCFWQYGGFGEPIECPVPSVSDKSFQKDFNMLFSKNILFVRILLLIIMYISFFNPQSAMSARNCLLISAAPLSNSPANYKFTISASPFAQIYNLCATYIHTTCTSRLSQDSVEVGDILTVTQEEKDMVCTAALHNKYHQGL